MIFRRGHTPTRRLIDAVACDDTGGMTKKADETGPSHQSIHSEAELAWDSGDIAMALALSEAAERGRQGTSN